VIVNISVDGVDWIATVRTSGRYGASERQFPAARCIDLVNAMVLFIAINLDPVETARVIAEQTRAAELVFPPPPTMPPVDVGPPKIPSSSPDSPPNDTTEKAPNARR
jgi:hypothetical protein